MNNNAILIVEDDTRIRQVLRIMLEAEGYKTLEASTVASGLALAGEYRQGWLFSIWVCPMLMGLVLFTPYVIGRMFPF